MKDELLTKSLQAMTEATTTSDVAPFAKLLTPLLYRVYTQSLVSQIADVQPMSGPVGKVYALISTYGGRNNDNLSSTASKVIAVTDGSAFAIDGTFTTATGAGVVVYKEDNNLLVKITSGYFANAQATTEVPAVTITSITSNRNYAKKVFASYSGSYTTAEGEALGDAVRNIDYEVVSVTVEAITRKLKSKISHESIEDMMSMFGHDITDDLLIEEMASEMIQEIDQEIITFLRNNASIMPDVILSNSIGMGDSLSSVADDIYINIYKASQEIMIDTKRRHNFFVIADYRTISLLMSNPMHTKPDSDEVNSYYMGKVGNLYNLYIDPYADESYCLVGYRSNNKEIGDAGLLFSPYNNTITPTVESSTGKSVIYNTVRYGFTLHPQDVSTGNNDSIFFKTFNVDTSGLVNFPM